jgi:hypothetical protein
MMKWFIACLIIIFFGLGFLIGVTIPTVFFVVDEQIDSYNRSNLLAIYNIQEE